MWSVYCVCVCLFVCLFVVCVCECVCVFITPPPTLPAEVCEQYNLSFCSPLSVYNNRSVYFDREEKGVLNMEAIERKMIELYHFLDGDQQFPSCQNALRHIICYGSLPFCKSEGKYIIYITACVQC